MGLFSLLRRKKQKQEYSNDEADFIEYGNMTVEEALSRSAKGKKRFKEPVNVVEAAGEYLSQMHEMQRRLEDSLAEYDSVTVYLTDIQKLDTCSLDKKAVFGDCARQIINLNKERDRHHKREQKITPVQYKYLSQYEDNIPKEIVKMQEQEKYQLLIKSDLLQLEGERGSINYERESALEKRGFIKKFSVAVCVFVGLIFMLLIWLQSESEANFTIPFFLTGVMALGAAAYIIYGMRGADYTYKMSDKKLNRLITLVNKIKLKYVNCTSALEYMYDKYHVNSSSELSFQWEEYVRIKDENAMYRHNTELLEHYHSLLSEEMEECGIADPEVWFYQPEALLDDREMVEVRHRLNVRRQKLRERIDSDSEMIERCKTEITSMRKKYPEYDNEIADMLSRSMIDKI